MEYLPTDGCMFLELTDGMWVPRAYGRYLSKIDCRICCCCSHFISCSLVANIEMGCLDLEYHSVTLFTVQSLRLRACLHGPGPSWLHEASCHFKPFPEICFDVVFGYLYIITFRFFTFCSPYIRGQWGTSASSRRKTSHGEGAPSVHPFADQQLTNPTNLSKWSNLPTWNYNIYIWASLLGQFVGYENCWSWHVSALAWNRLMFDLQS